jgi:hypothetical protein
VEAVVNEVKAKKTSNWINNDPSLYLYYCLINDTIKAAFLDCDNVLNHEELDARKSDKRPKTFEKEAAKLFNDAIFAPTSLHLPSLHSDFDETRVLCLEDMPGIITPEEVKSHMADSRVKLMAVISNWELSGNGFGQCTQEDEGFRCVEEEHFLDDNAEPSSKTTAAISSTSGILSMTRTSFSPDCAANTDSVPEVKPSTKKC